LSSVLPTAFVLDSSVALGAFFQDEQDDYALAVWQSMVSAQAVVPALWHLEMGNILSRALKAGRISAQALDDCWQRLALVGIQTLPPLGDARHWTQRCSSDCRWPPKTSNSPMPHDASVSPST
jgi:predicted nucleic acid-binding protein